MPRNTRTGAVLEQMVLPALEMGGYIIERQVRLTDRLGAESTMEILLHLKMVNELLSH